MSVGTLLYTWLRGKQVGEDSQRNRYYRSRRAPDGARERRWVVYDGEAEASRVPPAWHSWLHHTTDELPGDDVGRRWAWQREHAPNRTGTADAWRPRGHVLAGGARAPATGDYEAWTPGGGAGDGGGDAQEPA